MRIKSLKATSKNSWIYDLRVTFLIKKYVYNSEVSLFFLEYTFPNSVFLIEVIFKWRQQIPIIQTNKALTAWIITYTVNELFLTNDTTYGFCNVDFSSVRSMDFLRGTCDQIPESKSSMALSIMKIWLINILWFFFIQSQNLATLVRS